MTMTAMMTMTSEERKKPEIVILDSETVTRSDVSLDGVTSQGNARVYGFTPNDQVADRIGNADAVICNKCLITKEVFEKCPHLKYVGLFATGYNNVDLSAASAHGAVVCNVPSYSTDAVAQHTFAMLLNYYSRITEYISAVNGGQWVNYKLFSYFGIPTGEVCGKTMGIVGYGNIGRKVASIARAFGMNVITCTRSPQKVSDGTEVCSFEELLRRSDVVSLHCPLTSENQKMIDSSALSQMKDSALLINTARGGLIDENALAEALKEHRIAAACLDVLTDEPMREDCPLRNIDNCFITPHVAWSPKQTRERLLGVVAENLRKWLAGSPQNVVN